MGDIIHLTRDFSKKKNTCTILLPLKENIRESSYSLFILCVHVCASMCCCICALCVYVYVVEYVCVVCVQESISDNAKLAKVSANLPSKGTSTLFSSLSLFLCDQLFIFLHTWD